MEFHIDKALRILLNIKDYDVETYSEEINDFLTFNKITTKERLDLFLSSLKFLYDSEFYYDTSSNKIVEENAATPSIDKENIIKIDLDESESQGVKSNYETNPVGKYYFRFKPLLEHIKKIEKLFSQVKVEDKTTLNREETIGFVKGFVERNAKDEELKDEELIEYIDLFVQMCLCDSYNRRNEDASYNNFTKSSFYNFFVEILLSILNGEYITDNKYSRKIDKFLGDNVNSNSNSNDPDDDSSKPIILTLYNHLCEVLRNLSGLCIRLQEIYIPTKKDERPINIRREMQYPEWIDKSQTLGYDLCFEQEIFESIIDITLIDHSFITTEDNVKKLAKAISKTKSFESWYNYNKTTGPLKENLDSNIRRIVKILLIKECTMLEKMIEQPLPPKLEIEYTSYVFDDNSIKFEVQKHSQFKNIRNLEFYDKYLKYANELITNKELRNEFCVEYSDGCKNPDEKVFDEYMKKGHEARMILSAAVSKLKNLGSESKDILMELKDVLQKCNKGILSEEQLTPSFLITSLYYLNSKLKSITDNPNQNDNVDIIFEIFDELLKYLNNLFEKCSDNIRSIPFSTTWKSCFYKMEDNKITSCDAKDGESFVFVSLQTQPVNLYYMEKSFEYFKSSYDKLIKKGNKSHEKNLVTKYNDLTKRLEEERTKTIQLLAIFSGIISFVVVNATLIDTAKNIEQFCLFDFTFAMCLYMFVMLINHIVKDRNDSEYGKYIESIEYDSGKKKCKVREWLKWHHKRSLRMVFHCTSEILIFIVILLGLIFFARKMYPEVSSENKIETQNSKQPSEFEYSNHYDSVTGVLLNHDGSNVSKETSKPSNHSIVTKELQIINNVETANINSVVNDIDNK